MKALFAILGSALIAAAMLMEGSFSAFISLPSLLIVISGMCCFSLAHHSFSDIKQAFQHALSDSASPNLQKDLSVIATVRKTTYGSGIAGTLIGLIQMLQNLDDPSRIGPAMAVAILTAFYSVLLVEFLIDPMANRILSRAAVNDVNQTTLPPAQSAHAVGMVFSALMTLFVLLMVLN